MKERNRFRRRLFLVAIVVIASVVLFATGNIDIENFYCNQISISTYKGSQFNLLSFSAIIAGFMFTALSLMLSVGENETIKKLQLLNSWDTIHRTLIFGIYLSLATIALSAIILFIKLPEIIGMISAFVQFNFLIVSVVLFVFAVIDVEFIIVSVRNDSKKNRVLDAKIDKLRKAMNKDEE